MSKKFLPVVSFIVVYLFFLIVTLPASVLFNQIKLPKNIQIGSVSGTIWQSNINAIHTEQVDLVNVDVSLSLFSLFVLDPKLDITFGDSLVSAPEGKAKVSGLMSALHLTDVELNIAANTIASHLNLPIPVNAHNDIFIQLNEFTAGQPLCSELTGNIKWQKAAVTVLDNKVPLGELSANLECNQGSIELTLLENNNLGLAFSLVVGVGFSTSGNGYLTPNNHLPEEIKQVLPFLGQPDNQGRYRLSF